MELSTTTELHGEHGLVIGIANEASIAAGCARSSIRSGCRLLMPCDVRIPGQLAEVFEQGVPPQLGLLFLDRCRNLILTPHPPPESA